MNMPNRNLERVLPRARGAERETMGDRGILRALAELYSLMTQEQKRKLLWLQLLVVLMSITEIIGVASIGPFMALVGNPGQLKGSGMLADWYRISGLESPDVFLILMGLLAFMLLLVAGLFSIYTLWRLLTYGAQVGAELSGRLFRHYMRQPWLFHVEHTSSNLTHGISQECKRVSEQVIGNALRMNAKVVFAALMLLALFVYNPWVASLGLLLFAAAYLVLYRTVRHRLIQNSHKISASQEQRFKLMSEGFGGIKDILLLGRQETMNRAFDEASQCYAHNYGTSQTLSQTPRYIMEILAYGAVIMLVLYLLGLHSGDTGTILQNISIYALAGFKLLPAFQQIYASMTTIRGNLSAFENLRDALYESCDAEPADECASTPAAKPVAWVPGESIVLNDVSFRYPRQQEEIVKNLSMVIPANRVVGIVGTSGCGKSTIIDLLLGLIEPSQGDVLVDGVPLGPGNRRAWQNGLGFVPQSIFLSDDTIAHNITLGLAEAQVDHERLERAVRLAHLDDMVSDLPAGLETFVGERGVQLSGGQRQRIGIARALYQDASVLIFDEATSALDGITENTIMREIHGWSGSHTIVLVAHRISTVKQCEWIYMMDRGQLVDQGTYEDLIRHNTSFKAMAGQL